MKSFSTLLLSLLLCHLAIAQATWEQKASISGAGRYWSFAFSIGDRGYAGTGRTGFSGSPQADFWEYDSQTDVWTQMADHPAGVREGATGFNTETRGFTAFGTSFINFTKSVYEFLPGSNAWVQRADVPGIGFAYSHGFVIDSVYYIGPENGTNNVYAYQINSDTWSQVASYPGDDRRGQVTFTAMDGGVKKGYLGMGLFVFEGVLGDFFAYDPGSDTWTEVASISPVSSQSTAVGIQGTGYVYNVGGNKKDIYRYDPVLDEWTFVSSLPTDRIANASMFAIKDTGYIVFGEYTISGGNPPSNDLWAFLPGPQVNDRIDNAIDASQMVIRTQPTSLDVSLDGLDGHAYGLSLHTLQGQSIHDIRLEGLPRWDGSWRTDALAAGVYIIRVTRDGHRPYSKKLVIR